MKRWIVWLAVATAVALVGGGVWRALAARQAQQKALAESSAQGKEVALDLAPGELVTVQRQSLALAVPVSGALRAVESAMVRTRAAGELQGLTLREGDSVRAGQEIARIDPTEARARLRQAQQQADAAKAQVDISQRQFTNNRALVDQGFISATALVTSQASLEAAQSTYQAALAAADVARKALDDTVLRSPLTGQVSQRLAQPGERVGMDARIVEVVDLTQLELEALLSPADSLAVRVGQKARLYIEGVAQPIMATVARINPSAQAGSRTVPVYLVIEQGAAASVLRQGLFVQGALDTGRADVLALPLDAVRTDKPAPYVQAVQSGRVVYLPVKTGQRAVVGGDTLVAVEGVPEGTAVVAGRMGSLREGTPVRIHDNRESTTAAPAAASASRAAP